jgi:Ni,Fe-hydrogenase III large subunit
MALSAPAGVRVAAGELPGAIEAAFRAHDVLGAYADARDLHYLFAAADGVLDVHAARPAAGVAAVALAGTYPAFDWDEREMRDAHGVTFAGLPDPRPLWIDESGIPPALTAEGEGVSLVVVGPVHAGIIEPGRFTFSTGGETVIHLDAQLSYSRRGVEAFLRGADALAAAPRVARICAACSVARSWSYARALEGLAAVACDARSEYARVVAAELERIYNHLFDLASAAAGAGYGYGQTHGLGLKERAHVLCAEGFGHRLLFDAIVPGGVRTGALHDPERLRAGVAVLRGDARAYVRALLGNLSVLRRFEGAGALAAQTAQAFGAVGPARRASGGTVDLRDLVRYGAYGELPTVVQTEGAGDVAARVRVKAAELDVAFGLVDRALAALNGAAPPPPCAVVPAAGAATMVTEGPRGAELVALACDGAGAIERVLVRSASARNWPVVLRAMEGNIVPDFPLVNKSFNLCYACVDR